MKMQSPFEEVRKTFKDIGLIFNPYKRNSDVTKSFWNHFTEYTDDLRIDRSRLDRLRVENIEARKVRGVMHVKVTLENCGLLIGIRGAGIDLLRDRMREDLGMEVKIYVEESTLWKWHKYY